MYVLIDGVQLEHHDDVQGSRSCCLLQPWEVGCCSGSSRLVQHMSGCYQKGFAAEQHFVLNNHRRLLLKNCQVGQTDKFPSAGETAVRLATSASYGCVGRPAEWSGLLKPACGEEGQIGQRAPHQKFCLFFGITETVLPSEHGERVGC